MEKELTRRKGWSIYCNKCEAPVALGEKGEGGMSIFFPLFTTKESAELELSELKEKYDFQFGCKKEDHVVKEVEYIIKDS